MVWIAGFTAANSNTYGTVFSSIPQTFTHLQIRISGKTVATSGTVEPTWLQFNNDGSALYTYHRLIGDGSSATSNADISQVAAYHNFVPTSTSGYANMFGSIIVDFLDYANTNKFKTVRSLGGTDVNGAGQVTFGSALWRSTAAISSITVASNVTQFVTGTRIDLYGITTSQVTGA